MKILFIITGLGIGGAERLVVNLADALSLKGHEILICSLTGPTCFTPQNGNIRISRINIKKNLFSIVASLKKLRREIILFDPDVVHSHMVHANLLSRILRIFTNMPRLICTAHSTDEGGIFRMLGYRITHSLADLTTNVSEEAVKAFETKRAVPLGQMLSVPNAIDCKAFQPDLNARLNFRRTVSVCDSTNVFVSIGSLYPVKDHKNLILSFATVKRSTDNAVLWIVGDGPLRGELDKLVNALGLTDSVAFLGIRHDIPAILNAADVFVLSSIHEGFGLVVAEAMSTETLVVATDCGGVREVLGETGFLVPTSDSDSLADAMLYAIGMEAQDKQTLVQMARLRVLERFSIERSAENWLSLYVAS